MPKPKTIAIVIAIVIAINVAVYYWSRRATTASALPSSGPTGSMRRPRTMAEGVNSMVQGGRDIVDDSGAVIGYDFT